MTSKMYNSSPYNVDELPLKGNTVNLNERVTTSARVNSLPLVELGERRFRQTLRKGIRQHIRDWAIADIKNVVFDLFTRVVKFDVGVFRTRVVFLGLRANAVAP